jgi:2-dehydropantoate 2-reductase
VKPGIKIGVYGAGAIGCYLGGRLIAGGADVRLLARPALAEEIGAHGLHLSDYHGADLRLAPAQVEVVTSADGLADRELELVTVKGGDTAAAGADLKRVAPSATLVSFQNGVGNPAILREAGLRVLAGVVPWNVLRKPAASFHQGTSGRLAVEVGAPEAFLSSVRRGGLDIAARADVVAVQWGKLLINLNNSVNALAGVPIKDMLSDRGYRRVMAAIAREAVDTLATAGIPARLSPPLPPKLVPALLDLPDWLFRILARPMVRVPPHARSSMWDDLSRGRKTEIEQLNGEIVRVATKLGRRAPLSEKIVELVHAAEGQGSPALGAATLAAELGLRPA